MAHESTLGERIRAARLAASLEQIDVARNLGQARAGVSQWEAGVTTPPLEKIKLMAKLFNVPVEWLAFGIGVAPIGTIGVRLREAREVHDRTQQEVADFVFSNVDLSVSRNTPIARRIREAREESALSVEQVAGDLGLSTAAVRQWEDGYTTPSIQQVSAIAKLVNKSPAELAFGA